MFWIRIQKRFLHPITWLDTYNIASEPYAVTVAIFNSFYRKVLEDGHLPAIVLFPDMADHKRSLAGKVPRYAPLLDQFHAKGYRFIDLLQAFEPYESRYSIEELEVDWSQYSPLANRIAAEYMLATLEAWSLTNHIWFGMRQETSASASPPAPWMRSGWGSPGGQFGSAS